MKFLFEKMIVFWSKDKSKNNPINYFIDKLMGF